MDSEKECNMEEIQERPVQVASPKVGSKCKDNIVQWEEGDPSNPLNWSMPMKWIHMSYVAFMTFLVPLASSMFAPAITSIVVEFHSHNQVLAAFIVSVYVLGFALGPLVLAPLSEMYGRWYIYFVCNILHLVFTVAGAKSRNIASLIVFRLIAGAFGGGPIAIGGGTITDIFRDDEQAPALGLYALGPIIGPALGPVAGGYLSQAKGWRWIFWVISMAAGVIAVFQCLFTRETYHPILLERKAQKLRKQTGNHELRTKLSSRTQTLRSFGFIIIRPMKMLFGSWIISMLCVICGIVYGYIYLLFTMMPLMFAERYHFSVGSTGLTFIGFGVGSLVAVPVFLVISSREAKARASGGVRGSRAEDKLLASIPSNFFISVGLLWFGWSAERNAHWIVPILGTTLVGLGSFLFFLPLVAYLLEAYGNYSASAMAATTLLRSLGGATLPLGGRPMYERLGVGWASTVLALISLAFSPFPFLIWKYGTKIRARESLRLDA